MVLKKDSLVLYERDEKGELIPQETKLVLEEADKKDSPELVDQTIKVIPLTRGELKKMFGLKGKIDDTQPETDKDADGELIVKYCKDPAFTIEEIEYAKPVVTRAIVKTIFNVSGIKFDKGTDKKDMIENDEFGKNSLESDEKTKKVV